LGPTNSVYLLELNVQKNAKIKMLTISYKLN